MRRSIVVVLGTLLGALYLVSGLGLQAAEAQTATTPSSGTATAWSYNGIGQSSVPEDLGGVTDISAGAFHSLAIVSDTTPPTLLVSHTPDGTNGWNKTSPVTVNVSASDAGSGLAADPTCTDGSTNLMLTPGSTSGTWTASVSGEGTHNISCSVSDNATNQTTRTNTVKIDQTAPTVIGVKPGAGATELSRRTNVVATFSEKMQKSTLTKANFKLYKVSSATGTIQITNGTVTPNLAGTKVKLDPYGSSTRVLEKNTRYKAVVTTGVKDLAANALGAEKVWYFRTVVIGPYNRAPTAVGDSYSTAEDTTLNVSAPGVLTNDSDQEGDTITAQVATGPSHGTLTLNSDGSFAYKPNADYNGPDSFTYKAKDSHNTLSVAAKVSITVNAAPVAEDDSKTVAEDSGQTTIDVLANDTDVDGGGTKQIASAGNPEHGTVVVAGDNLSLSYGPDDNYCGQDTFSYTLNSGSTANVAVTVYCVNDSPVANDDSDTVDEGGTIGGNVLTNDTDSDGDALKAVLVSGPAHDSSFDLNPDGSFSYTHDGGDTTSDSFTYKASDGTADSTVATATITVLPPDAQCKTLAIQTLGSSFNPANYTFHGGTEGNDTFTGTEGQSEVFCGFGGDDSIGTLQAGDIFLGGDGNDALNTNNGTFYGDAGDDRVGDEVRAYDNNGTFYGGDGNDRVGNRNDGTFNGGAGNDSVFYNAGTFNGGDDNDQVRENDGTFNGDAGDDYVQTNGAGDFNGGDGNDTATYNYMYATFYGGDGNDSVTDTNTGTTNSVENLPSV